MSQSWRKEREEEKDEQRQRGIQTNPNSADRRTLDKSQSSAFYLLIVQSLKLQKFIFMNKSVQVYVRFVKLVFLNTHNESLANHKSLVSIRIITIV